jgi:DNA-binding transcriptional LysR family regulator
MIADADALASLPAAPPRLRIAATGTVLGELLPPALRVLRARHPGVVLGVRRAGAAQARALVASAEVDVAFLREEAAPAGLEAVRVGEDRLWLAVPRRSSLAHGPLRLETVARAALVGYGPASSTMRRVLAVLGPLGAAPWIEVDGKAAALRYVAEGLGLAFVSALASAPAPRAAGVVLRDVTARFGRTSFWMVWRGGSEPTGPMRDLADALGLRGWRRGRLPL